MELDFGVFGMLNSVFIAVFRTNHLYYLLQLNADNSLCPRLFFIIEILVYEMALKSLQDCEFHFLLILVCSFKEHR